MCTGVGAAGGGGLRGGDDLTEGGHLPSTLRGGAGVVPHRFWQFAGVSAEPSGRLDRPGMGLGVLDMPRKPSSEGCRTAWSMWPALGSQEQLGSSFEDRNRISICIEQTGFNYTIYTSSIFLLILRGLAVTVPAVAANCSPCGVKLHGRTSLILTFLKSMKGQDIRWWRSV